MNKGATALIERESQESETVSNANIISTFKMTMIRYHLDEAFVEAHDGQSTV